jgi:AAA15 family ATPase/GTPase
MLDSIEIKNFKRIGEDGLKLDKLAQVNYLVGENGSGKSIVIGD